MRSMRILGVMFSVATLLATGCDGSFSAPRTPEKDKIVPSGAHRWVPVGMQSHTPAAPIATFFDAADGVTVDVKLQGFDTQTVEVEKQAYLKLSIPEYGRHGEVGDPAMPFKGFYLQIPYGVRPEVVVEKGRLVPLGSGHVLYPVQPPQVDCQDETPPFTRNQETYSSDRLLPGSAAEIGQVGFIRGRRIAFLQVYPFRYRPATGELGVYESLRVIVRYRGQRDPAEELQRGRLYADSFESMASRLVANFQPSLPGQITRRQKDGADYLIIADGNFVGCLQPLVDWKIRKGYRVQVTPISQIGNSSSSILSYLQNAYDNWSIPPIYVLIVGDHGNVTSYPLSGLVSDLPYSLLEGSDYWPDITIGRLSVSSSSSCETVVGKILKYDRHPDIEDWYEHSLIAAYYQDKDGDCYADRWFLETAVHVYDYLKDVAGHSMHTAMNPGNSCSTYRYRSDGYPHRPSGPSTVPSYIVDLFESASSATNSIHDAFAAGIGLIQHRDHGATTGWGDPPFWVSDVNNLSNGTRTPVVFSMNCLTGKFDSSSTCFAEALQRHSNGGAVGIVAATEVSYSGYNDLLTHGVYTCMFPDYDGTHTASAYPHSMRGGEVLNFAKHYMYTYEGDDSTTRLEFRLFHWFGDPEMEYRPVTPQILTLTHPITLPPGTTSFTVGGAPDGALAALVQGQNLLGRAFSSGGSAVITISGPVELMEPIFLTVTHYSAVPYEAELLTVSDQGMIEFTDDLAVCESQVGISLMDLGLMGRFAYPVTVRSDTQPHGQRALLMETPFNSGVYAGKVTLTGGPVQYPGTLLVSDGDTITAVYFDADDGQGMAAIVTDNAEVHCRPPAIYRVEIQDVTSESATVCFLTDVPTWGSIQWGPIRPFKDQASDNVFANSHCVQLPGLFQCAEYTFQVRAEDELGQVSINNLGGHYFAFTAPHAGLSQLFAEYLDSDPGWTTSGDWEFGQPQGLGSGSYPDPTSGYTGVNVYGNDLSDDGDYPNDAVNYDLTSTTIDLSGAVAPVKLSFYRWLSIEQSIYDEAEVQGFDGNGWVTIWEHSGYDLLATEWELVEYDISQFAGQSDFQLRWTLDSDRGLTFGGWNIDDIVVYGTDPNAECPSRAPVAVTGPDQQVDPEDQVVLDGTGSFDPDGDPLTFAWTQVLGPPVALDDPASATPGFTAPNVPEETAVVFALTVSDGQLLGPPDRTRITINAGQISSLEIPSSDTPIGIPDNNSAGIESVIAVSQAGILFALEVDVNITHPWIGDLIVRLQAPSGEEVVLHNREGGSANNINQTYEVTDLTGESIDGEWKLLVSDHGSQDVGTLDDWTLRIWMY